MMKHTPTPWHKEKDSPKVRNASDVTVADCGSYYNGSFEKREANAAFIVEACNNYDALLLAAKRAAAYLVCDSEDVQSETLQSLIKAITPCDKKAGERILELRDSAIHKLRALQSGNEGTP